MSHESAKKFLEKTSTDTDLWQKLEACDSEEKFFDIAASAGYAFTREDWESVANEHMADQVLTDQDLENVAGGTIGVAVGWLTRLVCGQKTQPTIFPCADKPSPPPSGSEYGTHL
jgi:predicted ribosomally synthesized peptide with nif11-like leader